MLTFKEQKGLLTQRAQELRSTWENMILSNLRKMKSLFRLELLVEVSGDFYNYTNVLKHFFGKSEV